MVIANYPGRMGNHLFVYCFCRILAEEIGLRLFADSIPGFPGTQQFVDGDVIHAPVRVIDGCEVVDFEKLISERKKERICVRGYVQRAEYYVSRRDRIREWLALDDPEVRPGDNDLVIAVRLGDFVRMGWVLDFSYYRGILARHRFDNIWITSDEFDHPYLKRFRRYGVKYCKGDPLTHFKFIKAARQIVLCGSTFSWWASFLSDAHRIFFPVLRQKVDFWCHHGNPVNDLRIRAPQYEYIYNVELMH